MMGHVRAADIFLCLSQIYVLQEGVWVALPVPVCGEAQGEWCFPELRGRSQLPFLFLMPKGARG